MTAEELDRRIGERWVAAMVAGDFEKAWQQSDKLRARNSPDAHRFWNGDKLDGRRLIVRALHGLGDATQMLRYAPNLSVIASKVVFEVPPPFLPLAGYFNGVQRAITWGDHAPPEPPDWEVQMEIMELPYIFRTRQEELPLARDYLQIPRERIDEVAVKMGRRTKPRVGLVWAGGAWNMERSIPISTFCHLFPLAEVEFWNLQGEEAAADARGMYLQDATQVCGGGLVALAATIATLDLVVTVDTLAAHLAGAMGKPVWVMLQHAPDWRWMTGRSDSPWYPSMSLFRQPRQGDWLSVMNAVREALRTRIW